MLLATRGCIRQLARRLDVLDNDECVWLLRAARNSDEVRRPGVTRKSVQTTGRRLLRGSPGGDESVEFRPGSEAADRPSASFAGGKPYAEPDKSSQTVAVLLSDLSARARNGESQQLTYSLPAAVVGRLNGGSASAPKFPM